MPSPLTNLCNGYIAHVRATTGENPAAEIVRRNQPIGGTFAADLHTLATAVAAASRRADSPISYYHAVADIREMMARGKWFYDLPAYYEAFYGSDAWRAPVAS